MRLVLAVLLCVSFLTATARADELSDPRPHSGLGGIIVGWVGLGVAAGNAATLPLCYAYDPDIQDLCIGASTVFIIGGVAAAIPALMIGYKRRAAYKEWRARQIGTLRFETAGLDLRDQRTGFNLRFSF